MADIDFRVSKADSALIGRIVARATAGGMTDDALSLEMDLCATHNTTPLDLERLLGADYFNFAHDIYGIMRHMNRKTGKLGNFFVPRSARPAGK